MEHRTIVAYFESENNAREALRELRSKGYVTTIDVPDRNLPDPDFSVNAMMIGFLPDLAHGLFGTDNAEQEHKDSAYLLVIADTEKSENEITYIIQKHHGKTEKGSQ